MLIRLFKANPVLTTENTCIRAVFNFTLKGVIDDLHSDLSEEERIEIYGETLLEVDALMDEFNAATRTLN